MSTFKSNARRGGFAENVSWNSKLETRNCELFLFNVNLKNVRSTASPRVIWIASFPGAVIDGVSFVDCIFRGVRSTEVVEVGGSILFRKTGREGPKFELAADVL